MIEIIVFTVLLGVGIPLGIMLIAYQRLKYNIERQHELVKTPDGKMWTYDTEHCEWIDITMPEKMKGKIVGLDNEKL